MEKEGEKERRGKEKRKARERNGGTKDVQRCRCK